MSAFLDIALLLSNGIESAYGQEMGHPPALTSNRFDPYHELTTLCEHLKMALSRDDLCFHFDWDVRIEHLETDRPMFTNIFFCLIHNAMKYSDDDSTVRLYSQLDEDSGLAAFGVESVGEPILLEERERILEKTVRGKIVSQTGRRHAGIGLGLWIARQLLHLIDGELCLAADKPNPRTALFVVAIPVIWSPIR